jgi:endogenous inhibitor of DNA gyrase (YacG/DUF329 family)
VICPTCKKTLPLSGDPNPHRPFCSDRCRLVDLGAWLDGVHRIATPLSEDDSDEVVSTRADQEEDQETERN